MTQRLLVVLSGRPEAPEVPRQTATVTTENVLYKQSARPSFRDSDPLVLQLLLVHGSVHL